MIGNWSRTIVEGTCQPQVGDVAYVGDELAASALGLLTPQQLAQWLQSQKIQMQWRIGRIYVRTTHGGPISIWQRSWLHQHVQSIETILAERQGDWLIGDSVLRYDPHKAAWVSDEWYDSPFARFPDL